MVENTKGSKGYAVKNKESYHQSSAIQLHSSAGENKTKQKKQQIQLPKGKKKQNTTKERKKSKTII